MVAAVHEPDYWRNRLEYAQRMLNRMGETVQHDPERWPVAARLEAEIAEAKRCLALQANVDSILAARGRIRRRRPA